jgi:hypothetical protein
MLIPLHNLGLSSLCTHVANLEHTPSSIGYKHPPPTHVHLPLHFQHIIHHDQHGAMHFLHVTPHDP